MEFADLKRGILFLIMLCVFLLVNAPTVDARKRIRPQHRHTNIDASSSPGFTHYFVIVVIAFGAVLVFVCLLINSLRCILDVLGRGNHKQRERRMPGHPRVGHQADMIDQSELLPPPSYAEIVGEATAPPPAYSTLHVGDAGWVRPPYDGDGTCTEEHAI